MFIGLLEQLVWTFFLGSGVMLLMLYLMQNKLVYVPYVPIDARTKFEEPRHYGIKKAHWDEVMLNTIDNEVIQCWLFKIIEGSRGAPTLLFFHGNAGNLSHRMPNIKRILDELKCNVFIVSYRGYGKSSGTPSEIGIKLDSMAALAHLQQQRSDIDPTKIILFGRSIGGAVATDLAVHTPLPSCPPLKAVILENTFTSVYDMQQIMFPMLTYFQFLCTNRWTTVSTIEKITIPVLFISAGNDEIVPPWMMKKLFQHCQQGLRTWKHYEKGDHMDTWNQPSYFSDLKDFIDKLFL